MIFGGNSQSEKTIGGKGSGEISVQGNIIFGMIGGKLYSWKVELVERPNWTPETWISY